MKELLRINRNLGLETSYFNLFSFFKTRIWTKRITLLSCSLLSCLSLFCFFRFPFFISRSLTFQLEGFHFPLQCYTFQLCLYISPKSRSKLLIFPLSTLFHKDTLFVTLIYNTLTSGSLSIPKMKYISLIIKKKYRKLNREQSYYISQ